MAFLIPAAVVVVRVVVIVVVVSTTTLPVPAAGVVLILTSAVSTLLSSLPFSTTLALSFVHLAFSIFAFASPAFTFAVFSTDRAAPAPAAMLAFARGTTSTSASSHDVGGTGRSRCFIECLSACEFGLD